MAEQPPSDSRKNPKSSMNEAKIDKTGLLSYIRIGSQRRPKDYSSSPTISNPSGHYIWDFLNWGLTTPYGLERLANVSPNNRDIVPYADMDQGRLFVRVSVQDLATLQLAYQEGLAMLQKTQMRVSKLKEENEKLQAAIKDWSLQTAELTMDNAELQQEVGNLKRELRTGSISIDEHKELMDLLCQNVCRMVGESASTQAWQASAFNDLLKLVFSLPAKLQERLAYVCPNFAKLLETTEPKTVVFTDAKISIERILRVLPPDIECWIVEELARKLNKRKGTLQLSDSIKFCGVEHREKPLAPGGTTSAQRTSILFSEESSSISAPDLPAREYSLSELDFTALPIRSSEDPVNTTASALDRLDSLVSGTCDNSPEQFSSKDCDSRTKAKIFSAKGKDNGQHTSNGDFNTSKTISPHVENGKDEIQSKNTAAVFLQNGRTDTVYPDVVINNQTESRNSRSSSMGAPLAHSTPLDTLSTITNPRQQINLKPLRKRKKRKISRWNFAARICSSGRSNTMSDSESMDSSVYLQAVHPKMKIPKRHGRPTNGHRWLFKINKL
ncbi:uncharacterized protein [Watersipora subatra]|uniref:uncharacterized protein n=1 Tax=Watersipora subatra TaxID=2589382 RepID=UPI00355B0D97